MNTIPDDPENDGTDFAHPAWWRGEKYGADSMIRRFTEILDGKDNGTGAMHASAETFRRRLLTLAVGGPAVVKDKWIVNVKGSATEDGEISVLRSSNAHGRGSYGWMGEDKICIFSSGGPCHNKTDLRVWHRLLRLASDVANELNAGEQT